ncbi:MAG TPA: protein-disulfide reductase DsbD domain-containing protein, partial [Rariglobus sp.]|nr:protein-disulfide reductase DsbD domain-containing protein [Rariglobus sp.]
MPFRALFLSITLFLGLLAPFAHAQVKAVLAAADQSIQPGKHFTVALRLDHEKHWHSYWINPGTGYPTSLTWKLPAGWSASPIQWPTPEVTRDTTGMITGNGYSGVIYLPVTITPPADLKPGETITLAADAKWLMCAEVCVPGKAAVSLALPVRADTPAPDTAHGQAIATTLSQLPRAIPELTATAIRTGNQITLRL